MESDEESCYNGKRLGVLDVVIIKESIIIHSTVETVWKTFTDLTCWMNWNTVMTDLRFDEDRLTNGNDLKCSFRPFLFPIEVRINVVEVIPFDRVVWSAKKKGLFAFHEFFFQKREKGVLITSKETFSGLLTKGSGFLLPVKRMQTLTKIFLKDLKKASES